MEELELQEKTGFFSRMIGVFGGRDEDIDEQTEVAPLKSSTPTLRLQPRYHVSIRRQVMSLEDAQAAADGLLHGEQQIINLSSTEPVLRTKVIDFLSGVRYAQKAIWEEIGENIFIIAPSHAHCEVVPASPRLQAQRN